MYRSICCYHGLFVVYKASLVFEFAVPPPPLFHTTQMHTHTRIQHISQSFALRIMRLGSVPARLKLINSGFNSTECWLQTLQLCVLKHAPSSLIIKMCVLEKLMNKSLGGDYDWCFRNKQATIGCCRNQCGGQTNCRWTNCRIKQTAHSFHHMCIVFPMADYSHVVCSLNTPFFREPRGISYWMRRWSCSFTGLFCFPESQILGHGEKLWLALWWKEKLLNSGLTAVSN